VCLLYQSLREVQYCKCKTKKRCSRKQTDEDPWDKCKYKCGICDQIYRDRGTLTNHINQKHKIDCKSYVEQFGDPAISCPKWKCLVCGVRVKFSRGSVQTHLLQHAQSIEDYEAVYGGPDLQESQPYNPNTTQSTAGALSGTEAGFQPSVSANVWLPVPPLNHPIGQTCPSKGVCAKRSVPLPTTVTHQELPTWPDHEYQPGNLTSAQQQPEPLAKYQVPPAATLVNHVLPTTCPGYKYQPGNLAPGDNQDFVHQPRNLTSAQQQPEPFVKYQVPPAATLVSHVPLPTSSTHYKYKPGDLVLVRDDYTREHQVPPPATRPSIRNNNPTGESSQSRVIEADSPPMDMSDGESFPSSSEML